MEMAAAAQYELTESRIGWLTLVLGGLASAVAGYRYSFLIAAGVFTGTLLAWLNFLWLEHAMSAVMRASTAQANSPEAHVPISGYFGLFVRYALIAAIVYATYSRLHIPVLSVLVGLCALGAAAILASLWEVLDPASWRNE